MKYDVNGVELVYTPQLIYYTDIIRYNIELALKIAPPERIRSHVKSHKTVEIPLMQKEYGITKFKTATIAETEMLAMNGFEDIFMAYPLVGPNIQRFITLQKKFPHAKLIGLTDNIDSANEISRNATAERLSISLMIDLDPGLGRTGVNIEDAYDLCVEVNALPNIQFTGLHSYDGHNHQRNFDERVAAAEKIYNRVSKLKTKLQDNGISVPIVTMGGTPTFPCYAKYEDVELSPGTCFLQDAGYMANLPDMPFIPAAVVATRVVSVFNDGTITLDMGTKAVATDPKENNRAVIAGDIVVEHLFQNEEHWKIKIVSGKMPKIGEVLYAIPTHICPTSALYEEIFVVDASRNIVDEWSVISRKRKISI